MSCCSGGKSGKHKCRCVQNNAGGRRQTSGYDRKQRCGNLQKFLHLSRASPPSQSVSISPSNSVNRRRWSADRPDNNFKLSSRVIKTSNCPDGSVPETRATEGIPSRSARCSTVAKVGFPFPAKYSCRAEREISRSSDSSVRDCPHFSFNA